MSVPADAPTTTRMSEIPVLISGAGPTGLFAAFLLDKMGIPYRLIERDPDFSILTKSLWVHSRTLEILQMSDSGLIQQALDQGSPTVSHRFYYGGKLVRELNLMPRNSSHFNNFIYLQQSKTVRILFGEIEKQGGKVDWGWELMDTKVVEATVEGNSGGEKKSWVETTIRRALTGTNKRTGENKMLDAVDLDEEDREKQYEYETIKSQFLIGADGARSVVRHKLNIPFLGRTRDNCMMTFDGTVETDVSLEHINWLYNNSAVVVLPLGGNTVQIMGKTVALSPEEFEAKKNETLTVEIFQKYLDEAAYPQKITIKTVNWLTYYRVNERRAQEFSYKGRIFLAGDAAHIHSPCAGQGLNLGLQDSYSLAWRIALVVKGVAPISLLDSYGEERTVVADQMGQHYHVNSLNKKHKTQSTPSGQGAVGRRAGDAPLVPLPGNNDIPGNPGLSEMDSEAASAVKVRVEKTRLHELIAYPGVFQVVVFTGDLWRRDPESAMDLSKALEKYLGMWRSKWCTVDDREGKETLALKRLIMVHTITTISASITPNPLTEKDLGEGRAYTDLKGKLHGLYSVDATVKKGQQLGGAIVVVRPDSHIAYRVQGIGKSAWNDVGEYFESILV